MKLHRQIFSHRSALKPFASRHGLFEVHAVGFEISEVPFVKLFDRDLRFGSNPVLPGHALAYDGVMHVLGDRLTGETLRLTLEALPAGVDLAHPTFRLRLRFWYFDSSDRPDYSLSNFH